MGALCAIACTNTPFEPENTGAVATFKVELANVAENSAESPLPFPSTTPATVDLIVEAVTADGTTLGSYNGAARIRVVPGSIVGGEDRIQLENGRGRVTVAFRYSFDKTRIWVEDVGEDVSSIVECTDGLDNDADGLLDQFDPDCQQGGIAEPGKPDQVATGATGISTEMYFAKPQIRDVQFSPQCTTDTPLGGQNVTIETGALIVTGTTQSGMYVTDLTGPEGGYNSLYLFTFSNPGDVKRGDRLCSIAGNAAEFIANSQLNFPSFVKVEELGRMAVCDPALPDLKGEAGIPDPVVLTAADVAGTSDAAATPEGEFYRFCGEHNRELTGLDDWSDCMAARGTMERDEQRASPIDCARDNFAMEANEHALVAVENVVTSQRFVRCDLNDNGRIERGRGSAEGDCDRECADDPLCSVRLNVEGFGQFSAGIDCTDADPPVCAGRVFVSANDTIGGSAFADMAHATCQDALVGPGDVDCALQENACTEDCRGPIEAYYACLGFQCAPREAVLGSAPSTRTRLRESCADADKQLAATICGQDEDCLSGTCLRSAIGGVCSATCDANTPCPGHWTCGEGGICQPSSQCSPMKFGRLVGHLRQLQPGAGVPSSWVVEPRFINDFVLGANEK